MPAIGQSGSEGGAKSAFVPTPINSPGLQAISAKIRIALWRVVWFDRACQIKG